MELRRVIDCHVHVFDPGRFPYRPDTHYAPACQELGTPARLQSLLDVHGVDHALLVGPNSGYGEDNRCLLDTLAASHGRHRGMAVVRTDISRAELAVLRGRGSSASPSTPPFSASTTTPTPAGCCPTSPRST